MNIGIYIYDYAEPIDFSGPYEVFASANRYASEYGVQFTPYLISEAGCAISARHGFQVLPHRSFDNHPNLDALIVVGGAHKHEMNNQNVINWIQKQAKNVKFVASVGTGAFLLAQANLLQGRRVTTHWQDIEQLAQEYPSLSVVKNVRWVEDGEVMTSSGMSAGIDMSLQIVARLSKLGLAKKTAHQIGFDWREEHVVAY